MAGIRDRTDSNIKYEPASKLKTVATIAIVAIGVCLSTSRQVQGSFPNAQGLSFLSFSLVGYHVMLALSVLIKVSICVPGLRATLCTCNCLQFGGTFLKGFAQLFGCG